MKEKFQDTKVAIRSRKSKIPKWQSEAVNQRRTNNTVAKRKRTNNDLQDITQKTKDRVTRTSLKIAGELWKG